MKMLVALIAAVMPAVVLAEPVVPQAEQLDVATLKADSPHRVFTPMSIFGGEGFVILDGDSLAVEGAIPHSQGVLALDPAGQAFYVCETIYTRGNRGTRQDLVSVYDARTLNLRSEIPIPGRLIGPYPHNCDISGGGKYLYVYNMEPASSVIVVDLARRRVASVAELPGCSAAFPWRDEGFAALCGDGTLAMVSITGNGGSKVLAHTQRFFDADNDPIVEGSVVDRGSGRAYFLSYTGLIYPVQLSDHPSIEKPWSLQGAAGQPVAGTGVQELAWRPGGWGMLAWNKAKNRLYVLMHMGTHWTQMKPGTEVWVLDPSAHTLLKRLELPEPTSGIAISQDEAPLLYALSENGDIHSLDAETGQQKVKGTVRTGVIAWVPGF